MKNLYREMTGEDVPNPDGCYTIIANLNEKRKDMAYSGYLSYTEEGDLLYTPYVFPDEEVHISECTYMYGIEKEKIYDCTELISQSTVVSEDIEKIIEAAWEKWNEE